MEEDAVSEDGSVSSTSYNLRSFCSNKNCVGEGLTYTSRISPSPSSSRAGTPASELDRSLYSAVNGERRIRRKSSHHHHHHHGHHQHGPESPLIASTPEDAGIRIQCGLETLEEESPTPSEMGSIFTPPRPARSMRPRVDSTLSVLSEADSVFSNHSLTNSVRPTRSRTDSVRSTHSRTDSVRSTRSRTDSVRSTRSRVDSVSSVHSEEKSMRSNSKKAMVVSNSTEVNVSITKTVSNSNSVEKVKRNLMENLAEITENNPELVEAIPLRANASRSSSTPRKRFDFELAPKTGYTYAKSLAYRETISPGRDNDTSPNMTRQSIRDYSSSAGHGYNLRSRSATPQPFQSSLTPMSERNGPFRTNSFRSTSITEFSDDEVDFPNVNGGYRTEPAQSYAHKVKTWIWSMLSTVVTTVLLSWRSQRTTGETMVEASWISRCWTKIISTLDFWHSNSTSSTCTSTGESSWITRCWTKIISTLFFWRSDSTSSTSTATAFGYSFLNSLWHWEKAEEESSEDHNATTASNLFTTSLIKLLELWLGLAASIWLLLRGTPKSAWYGLKPMCGFFKFGLFSAAVSIYRLICWTYLLETWILVQAVTVRQSMWRNRRWLVWLLVPLLLLLLSYASARTKVSTVDEKATVQQGIIHRLGGAWKYMNARFDDAMGYGFLWSKSEKEAKESPGDSLWQRMWETLYNMHNWLYSGNIEEEDFDLYGHTEKYKASHQESAELHLSYISLLKQIKEDDFFRELIELKSQLKGYLETQENFNTLRAKLDKFEAWQEKWTDMVETLRKKSDDQDETNAEIKQQLHQFLIIDTVLKKHETMLDSLGAKIESFQAETKKAREEGEKGEEQATNEKRLIRERMDKLREETVSLEQSLKNCCSDKLVAFHALQDKMNDIWAKLLEHNEKFVSKIQVQQSIDETFDSLKQKIIGGMEENAMAVVEKNIDLMSKKLKEDVERKVQVRLEESLGKLVIADISRLENKEMNGSIISTEYINRLIQTALAKYDADKTGMADYALESSGGTVVSTRCSETYTRTSGTYYFLGIPIWRNWITPRSVIHGGVKPGDCWAFKGSRGFLVIRLSTIIKPTAFSLEHIPKSLSPDNSINSAPRNFSVYGLEYEKEPEGVELGNYEYKEDGEPLQYFIVMSEEPGSFRLIEIRVHSNWGNLDFTCMYRFRVHGTPVKH